MKKDWIKELFSDWLTSKPKLMALSLVIAVFIWSFVAFSVNSISTRTIDGIKVEIPSTGASYQSLGLDIIDNGEEYTVSVTVSGDRSIIGNLNADSITVTPDFSKVTEAGTYNITLNAEKNNQLLDYEIRSVNPARLVLTFGESVMRRFQITPVITGFNLSEGYVTQPFVASPASITVVGSSETVDRIRKVTAEGVLSGTLTESHTVPAVIRLYDAEDNEISTDLLRIDYRSVDVLVPVYKQDVMSFDIEFTNVPAGFDTSVLRYTLSPSSISVAYTGTSVTPTTVRTIGYIDMTSLDLNGTYDFDLTLPSGYVKLVDADTVSVKFNSEGMSSLKMTVTDIRVSNLPEGYEAKILTDRITGVTVIGETEDLSRLVTGSLTAVIDGSQLKTDSGIQSVAATVIIPSGGTVWAVGTYTVNVEVTRR
ncbi:MAG: hypothetical protein IJH41_00015 [Eubacterium sp.]|nr:hypothetical protein [Eubacterium sp.]MBQ3412618.1 hypothetical protein [Oscillospiraceae bacterium]